MNFEIINCRNIGDQIRSTMKGKSSVAIGKKKKIVPTYDSSILGGKPNLCVIHLPKSGMVAEAAEALERKNKDWIIRSKVASDLIVQVGDVSFHLHKLAMVSKSGYLSRLVLARTSTGEEKGSSRVIKIVLQDLPGGSKSFKSVVNFCYGRKVDVTASNVAPLYCAANFLEMNEGFHQGNLISQTEAFLSFALTSSSWKDTFHILKSCELVSSWAKELLIVKRCSDAIACMAFSNLGEHDESFLANRNGNWWFEDVATLRIDHFIQVIESIKRKGMKSELVGSCIANWTIKWFSRVNSGFENLTPKHLSQKLQRVTIGSLIKMLPLEKNSVSCNFLLQLLKFGLVMQINSEMLSKMERRIALMLEHCSVQDLLVKNCGDKDSIYDVGVVIRVVKNYVKNAVPRSVCIVGKLMDGYLTLIARDINLSVYDFKSLVEALPTNARYSDDNLYRAMDMYLKAHPHLTEEERKSVCETMEYHRLSEEARQHAMKNDRLPLKVVTQFMLLDQVKMVRFMTANEANQKDIRTKTRTSIKGLDRGCMQMTPRKEIKLMRNEVENMKMQLNQLQLCKAKLQSQVKRCIK